MGVLKGENDLYLQALEEKEKGNAAYKKKDLTTALEHYNKAVELDPVNIVFRNNRAGKLEHYNKAVELDPVNIVFRNNRVGRLDNIMGWMPY